MQRDRRLSGLSSDHHRALVLARRVRNGVASAGRHEELARIVRDAFEQELGPHFGAEEELLVPALHAAGQDELAARVLREHRMIRVAIGDARHDATALLTFADALTEHVRFEERELFPVCERVLGAEVLAAMEARVPPPRTERTG